MLLEGWPDFRGRGGGSINACYYMLIKYACTVEPLYSGHLGRREWFHLGGRDSD